jgi:methionyl-tRNA synthetase
MPYGNKELHFGHVGGVFVHADTFARFLRDRIGNENVLFVSGTDCYGSPIMEHYRRVVESGNFSGSIQDFVESNHKKQKQTLDKYQVGINLFAASSFGRSGELHREMCGDFFKTLYKNGHLRKLGKLQFYDSVKNVFLNGRQVTGRCPVPNCRSEKAYADECSLGHPYEPRELIDPRSSLSGEVPELREVSNWYVDVEAFKDELARWVASLEGVKSSRKFVISAIQEFLEPPTVYVKQDQDDILETVLPSLPEHVKEVGKNKTVNLVFSSLDDRETASSILTEKGVRYRNGKTLVPFRLTGNAEWGLPVPEIEEMKDLTFWVWPESLWAPISFTATWLESQGRDPKEWKKWWASKDCTAFQFIGEDNVYFYSLAEVSMFMGDQDGTPVSNPPEGELQTPNLIVNNHILYFDKKASSSSDLKPPMANELLDYYTPEQLRAHFFALGLGKKSVSFRPRALNPDASDKEADPVLKEGNLLSNVFNKAVRNCLYNLQQYYESVIPVGDISPDIASDSKTAICKYEMFMHKHEFHQVMFVLDNYIRQINKFWNRNMESVQKNDDEALRRQTIIDVFHMLRTATVLMHPVAPQGTAMILEYLGLDERFWDWNYIFEKIYFFMDDPRSHKVKFLEPRVDFFEKHPSQYQ